MCRDKTRWLLLLSSPLEGSGWGRDSPMTWIQWHGSGRFLLPVLLWNCTKTWETCLVYSGDRSHEHLRVPLNWLFESLDKSSDRSQEKPAGCLQKGTWALCGIYTENTERQLREGVLWWAWQLITYSCLHIT